MRQKRDDVSRPLQYHTRALWLLALYIPLVLVPWILTCILAKRPINAKSYVNHTGFTLREVSTMRNWRVVVNVLDSIAGLITVPVLSALLAQAAVVYSQRRQPKQFLSLRDVFDLADRGWTDLLILWRSLRKQPKKGDTTVRPHRLFLLLAATLILLGGLQQPLNQILVRIETILVTTNCDTSYTRPLTDAIKAHCSNSLQLWFDGVSNYGRYEIGNDIEPIQMALIEQVDFLPQVATGLATISLGDVEPNIWVDHMTEATFLNTLSEQGSPWGKIRSLSAYMALPLTYDDFGSKFFVASIPANSTTGVLREHIMRLNSSIQCMEIDRALFPEKCAGKRPFATSFLGVGGMDIRICIPGEYGSFPWSQNRSRQDISEEIFLDLRVLDDDPLWQAITDQVNATVHCVAGTTRGYFELGNYRNNNEYGKLLHRWPTPEEMSSSYHDWISGVQREPVEL